MGVEYLVKLYLRPLLDSYIKELKINALDIEATLKDGSKTRFTKEQFEKDFADILRKE